MYLFNHAPRVLPTNIDKDILILAAVWDGDIESYSRPRRPRSAPSEISAVMRGAQHHTAFARWRDTYVGDLSDGDGVELSRQVINARFIINNNFSRITPDTNGDIWLEIFWWPQWPQECTLRELAWR